VTEEFKAASTTRANELAWIWGPDMVRVAISINDCEREEEQERRGRKSRESGAFRCFMRSWDN
jgi:hypothetical protein